MPFSFFITIIYVKNNQCLYRACISKMPKNLNGNKNRLRNSSFTGKIFIYR